MSQTISQSPEERLYEADQLRLEVVTTCIGFHDMLDVTLGANHGQVDTMIVVTSHEDKATQGVAKKHGATVVVTDLFKKNGRKFNKGAAINAGMNHFQYHGWRAHLDCDTALSDSFRRIFFNHTDRDQDAIYGCDRVDVIGLKQFQDARARPQHRHGFLVMPCSPNPPCSRYVDGLSGFVPIGYFQLWHARTQKTYPFSLGTAAHDDVAFAMQWPVSKRRLLPTAIVHHLVSRTPRMGENWDGVRRQPRFS